MNRKKAIRWIPWLLAAFLLILTGCSGNYGEINLQEPVSIPEDGIIHDSVLSQIQLENAIATFQGTSNGIAYDWTIFGSDIETASQVNLQVSITDQGTDGIHVQLAQEQPMGFPALLAIHLPVIWDAQSATAWQNETAVCSVSLSGSSETILNFTVQDTLGKLVIRPDEIPQEPVPEETTRPTEGKTSDEGTEPEAVPGSSAFGTAEKTTLRVYSDGGRMEQDQYFTDPIPAGKPLPVEPENQQINTNTAYTCTFSIDCVTILNNLDMLNPNKREMVPSGGVILPPTTVTFYEGESVFDVLQRVCREYNIHMEASWTPMYNSAYVEGIHNLYEFDCGSGSGWMYKVDGWYPNYGCSRYSLKDGETVDWRYTCDLGFDLGRGMS